MKLLDALVYIFIGVIIGIIIMVGVYGHRMDKYKSLIEEYSQNSGKCTELLYELQDLAHRQNEFIQELTH